MNRGLTVVELLVLLAIVALIISGIAGVVAHIQAKTRDNVRVEHVEMLQQAFNLYYVSANRFPESEQATRLDGSDAISISLIQANLLERGFSGDPKSPTYDYVYHTPNPGTYTITFCLETDTFPNFAEGCDNVITP